jgi:protein TonB
VQPQYPPLAQAARKEGVVIVELTIGTDGRVQDAKILKSVALLDQAALDAVRQWVFTPTLLNGVPQTILYNVTVTFQLR